MQEFMEFLIVIPEQPKNQRMVAAQAATVESQTKAAQPEKAYMKKILLSVVAMTLLGTMGAATGGSWTGWISDAKCGANIDAVCARKCAAAGEKMVFVTIDKTVIPITNPEAIKDHAGDHVKIKGTIDNGSLTVSSVKTIQEKKVDKK